MDFLENFWEILSNPTYRGWLLQGFGNTIIITVCSAILGLIIGFIVAIIKILAQDSKALKIPAIICEVYTTVIRGTPVALQLFIIVLQILLIPNFEGIAVILTFGINSGAYVSESIRAGIQSVDKGQMEAGRALGLSQMKTMTKIILPQAIKNVIPAIGNELIALLKETSVVQMVGSSIGYLTFDLTYAAKQISIKISDYFVPTLLAGCFYLAIVYLITFVIKIIERRLKASDRY